VPFEQRKPITELARELGISHQLACYNASQVPWPDAVAKAAAHIRARLPQLRKAASAGNKQARALLRQIEGNTSRG
jgi:hypothetical protein